MTLFICTVLFFTPEFQFNEAGSSDTETPFLDVHLPISNFFT